MVGAGETVGSGSFERLVGSAGIGVGVGGLAYSAAFVTYLESGSRGAAKVSSLLLMLGGLVGIPFLVGVYRRLQATDPGVAQVGLVLALVGVAGTAIHGAYDLANFIKPPGAPRGDLPNAVDPRGVLTFGLTGLGLLVLSWLILEGGRLPRALGRLGVLAGLLLVYVYLGRLIILNPKNPALLAGAVLSGFVVNPIWAIWTGLELRRGAGERP